MGVVEKKSTKNRINRSLPYYSEDRVGGCPLVGFEILQSAATETLVRRYANNGTLI